MSASGCTGTLWDALGALWGRSGTLWDALRKLWDTLCTFWDALVAEAKKLTRPEGCAFEGKWHGKAFQAAA